MTGTISAEIPGLPTTLWKAYTPRRGGGKFLSTEARAWCELATIYLLRHRPHEPIRGKVQLEIVLTTPTKRRWDVENRVKVLSDLLTRMGFWGDDSQVWELIVRRETGTPERTEITIDPLSEPFMGVTKTPKKAGTARNRRTSTPNKKKTGTSSGRKKQGPKKSVFIQ